MAIQKQSNAGGSVRPNVAALTGANNAPPVINRPPSWYTGANDSAGAEAKRKQDALLKKQRASQRREITAGYWRGTNASYGYRAPVPSWFEAPTNPRVNQRYNPATGQGYQSQQPAPVVPEAYGKVPAYYQEQTFMPVSPPVVGGGAGASGQGGDSDYFPTSIPIIEREQDWLNQNAQSPYLPSWLFEDDGGGTDWWGGRSGGGGGGYRGYVPGWYTGLFQLNANR